MVSNMRSKGIFVLLYQHAQCQLEWRRQQVTVAVFFFSTSNRPTTRSLHQIKKLLGERLRCPLNVLRVASLEVLPWHGLRCSARELNFDFDCLLIRLLPSPLFFDWIHSNPASL